MSDERKGSQFALNPADYGVPTREELLQMRIWDMHYHGLWEGNLRQHEETQFYVQRMGIERVFSLDIAGTPTDPLGNAIPQEKKQEIRELLENQADRVSGLIPIDPAAPVESRAKMEEWIRNGPCVGIKYYGGNAGGITCSHANNIPIIELAAELNALVYIHTWLIVGGEPRRPGGGNQQGRDRAPGGHAAPAGAIADRQKQQQYQGCRREASQRPHACTPGHPRAAQGRGRAYLVRPWRHRHHGGTQQESDRQRARFLPRHHRHRIYRCGAVR